MSNCSSFDTNTPGTGRPRIFSPKNLKNTPAYVPPPPRPSSHLSFLNETLSFLSKLSSVLQSIDRIIRRLILFRLVCFFDEFSVYLENIIMCLDILLITGDFNFPLEKVFRPARNLWTFSPCYGTNPHMWPYFRSNYFQIISWYNFCLSSNYCAFLGSFICRVRAQNFQS